MRVFQRWNIIGVLLALLLTLMLSGCSAVKLGYNNAPGLSYWWLDSYLDFNDAQSLQLRADLTTVQTWHRAHELPVYIDLLQQMQRMVPTNVTPEQVCGLYDALQPRLQALLDQIEPILVRQGPTLSEDQLDFLARKLHKRSEKWRAEWMDGTPAQRSERRVAQLLDRAEMLYGPLDEPQQARLRASVERSGFDAATSYRESLRRHQDTLQTLRLLRHSPADAPRDQAAVHALLARTVESPDASYRRYMEKLKQENCKAFSALHNSTTPVQRQKAVETFSDYETDARALMALSRP